jgi:starch synthase
MTKVLMVASESVPFAKTGGLADVVGTLSAALRAQGDDVAVLLPCYWSMSVEGLPLVYDDLRVWFGPNCYTCRVYLATANGVPYYLADCPPLFGRDGLYGDAAGDYADNHVRFAVLSRVALTLARHAFRPQILHCHDWQAALVPIYLRHLFPLDPTFLGIKTVLTIHNLGYPGAFPKDCLPDIGLDPSLATPDQLGFFGQVSLLKGGILASDAITTVSKTYAREIQTPELGFGLDTVLRQRSGVLTGVLNGVDYSVWDPAIDPKIAAHYSAGDLEGKRACKADLLREFGLPIEMERPLAGIVSRFAGQKGFDLIEEAADEMMSQDVALVALGTGDPRYEKFFRDLAAAHPDKVAVRIIYDEVLAHKIEAGADLFLMPSLYEPCGLNQIYSSRYGTVPVVRSTGGLDDTIDEETGFKFREYSGRAMMEALSQALAAYKKREKWIAMMRAGMKRDFSWTASAGEYSALYRQLAC